MRNITLNEILEAINYIYHHEQLLSVGLIFIWGYWTKHFVDRKKAKYDSKLKNYIINNQKNHLK